MRLISFLIYGLLAGNCWAGEMADQSGPASLLNESHKFDRPDAVILRNQEQAAGSEQTIAPTPLLLFEKGRIAYLDPATGSRLWQAAPISFGTPVWLGRRDRLLLFSTWYQLFAVDSASGVVRWRVGEPPALATSPAIDPEILTRIKSVTLGDTRLVALLSDGRGMGVEIADGRVLWNYPLPRKAGGPTAINDQHLAYVAQGDPPALVILTTATGQQTCVFPLAEYSSARWCGFAPDRKLLVAGGDWLAKFDPGAQMTLWQRRDLKPNCSGPLLVGSDRFYVVHATGLTCCSLADGQAIWTRELAGLIAGTIVRTSLDAARLYVLTERAVVILDAAAGQVLTSVDFVSRDPAIAARWAIGSSWFTSRHMLITGLWHDPRQEQEPSARADQAPWELRAYWIARGPTREQRVEGQSLGNYQSAPDVGPCGPGLSIQAGGQLAIWTWKIPNPQSQVSP